MRRMTKGTVEQSSGAGAGRNGSKGTERGSGKMKVAADSQTKATFVRAFVDALNDILSEERRRRAA
jgi:hypothetical protein